MKKRVFVNLTHARTEEQRLLMEQIAHDKVCPFCPGQLEKYHPRPLTHSAHWTITKNMAPYEGAKEHWLMIAKRHLEQFSDLSPDEYIDLCTQVALLEQRLQMSGLTVLIRSGKTTHTGGSVSHLHAHVIAGGTSQSQGKPIRIKVGYAP